MMLESKEITDMIMGVRLVMLNRSNQLVNKREKKVAKIWIQATLATLRGELEKRRQANGTPHTG